MGFGAGVLGSFEVENLLQQQGIPWCTPQLPYDCMIPPRSVNPMFPWIPVNVPVPLGVPSPVPVFSPVLAVP